MFATMPIVAIKFFGRYFSLFTVFFGLAFVCLFFAAVNNGFRGKIGKNTGLFLIWLIMAVCSSFFGWLYFKTAPAWRETSLFYLTRIAMYFVFAVLWSKQRNGKIFVGYVLKGLVIGCTLNMAWAVIDAVGYYSFGISVNNFVFKQYAIDNGTRFGTVSLIINGMIRAGGFNDDPAHIGFIAPAMIAYSIHKKNGWLFLLATASIFASASTTALLCSVIVMIICAKRILKLITKKNVLRILICLPIILLVLLLIPNLYAKLFYAVQKFINRIFSTYGNIGNSGERSVYLFEFFKAITIAGVMCLFGTGLGTASYAYVFDPDILKQLGEIYNYPYDMEMTYIAYFFDLGIFGFTVYMVILFKLLLNFNKYKDEESIAIRTLVIGMALSALFYHYTLMAMQIILIIMGMAKADYIVAEKRQKLCLSECNTLKDQLNDIKYIRLNSVRK